MNLTLSNVQNQIRKHLNEIQHRQILDPHHPQYGNLVNPEYDLPDPKMAGNFIVQCGLRALADQDDADQWLDRALLAADALLQSQRPSGLLDLLSVNYDSAPDVGFTFLDMCPVIEMARPQIDRNAKWPLLLEKLERFVRKAVPGMLTGGFHTPNHRWVIVAALAQAKALFPDLDVKETVEAYLAEGFDVDSEGAYLERSVGVYDAVNNYSLMIIAEHWPNDEIKQAALAAVQHNLNFDLHLLHADGTAETGLSRRQDYGTRSVPITLIPALLFCNHFASNPVLIRTAHDLWEKHGRLPGHVGWLSYALYKCGDPPPIAGLEATALPDNFAVHYPHNGIWRMRQGDLSASCFQGGTRLMTAIFGQAELSSLKISQTYFGFWTGRFVCDSLTMDGECAVLRSEGKTNPRRPGYELPLGRPVPPDEWKTALQNRKQNRLPWNTSTLTVERVEETDGCGFNLHYRTLDGLDGVAAQIAFDFPAGGIWETNDSRLQPVAGQVLFLKQGHGTMRYGNDVIQIGTGNYAHGMWEMREAETAPSHVRILITFMTPIDRVLQLRFWRGVG